MIRTSQHKGLSHDSAVTSALSLSVHKRPKYHLRAGLLYLHWSGSKLTDNRDYAWSGNIDQARACRRTFDAAAGCKAIRADLVPVLAGEDAL